MVSMFFKDAIYLNKFVIYIYIHKAAVEDAFLNFFIVFYKK